MSLDADTERRIIQSIDEALETLGNNGKRAVTRYLERDIGLKKREIPQKPEQFRKVLDLILGEHGADVLEAMIARKLLTSLGLSRKSKMTLAEAISVIKASQEKSC